MPNLSNREIIEAIQENRRKLLANSDKRTQDYEERVKKLDDNKERQRKGLARIYGKRY